MAVKLFATDGEIMVGARTACYVMGRFNVNLPEGKSLAEDPYAAGYEAGYLYRPPEHTEFEAFDFGFVQADVTVDAELGLSDFEAVVDSANERVAEDVFVNAQISGDGLGLWEAGRDYDVGDLVDVELLDNRSLSLPVDRIAWDAAGQPMVRVGSQMIRDLGTVEEQNRQMRERIAREAATTRGRMEHVASTANEAKADASDAKADAGEALRAATDADGVIQGKLTEARSLLDTARTEMDAVAAAMEQRMTTAEAELASAASAVATVDTDLAALDSRLYGEGGTISAMSQDIVDAHNLAAAAGEKAMIGTVTEYALSASETVAPTVGWSTATPTRTPGTYIWMRTVITYGDGRTTVTSPVLLTGNDGADGLPGADGKGVASTVVSYASSTSATVAPTTGWSSTVPTVAQGSYLWTRTITNYTSGTPTTAYSTARQGANGSNGTSVTSVTPFYRLSATAPAQPSGTADPAGWSKTEPGYAAGQKLYRADRVLYSNNTASWTPVTEVASYSAATLAINSANGKNTITRSTAAPSGTGKAVGDTWFRVDGTGQIIGQWTWDGTAWKLAQVTSEVIANLDAGKITSGTIDAGRIGAQSITGEKIKAGTITATQIRSGTITGTQIEGSSISSDKLTIKNGFIKDLMVDTIAADKLRVVGTAQINEQVVNKIWADGIAAKSISTNSIYVSGGQNMLPEISAYNNLGYRPEGDPYRDFGHYSYDSSMWLQGTKTRYIFQPLHLVAGVKYHFMWSIRSTVNDTRYYWQIMGGTVDEPYSTGVNVKITDGSSSTSYLAANLLCKTSWRDVSVEFEPLTTGVHYLRLFANHTRHSTNPGVANDDGYQWIRDVRVQKKSSSVLIENGAITADHIKADTISVKTLKADTFTLGDGRVLTADPYEAIKTSLDETSRKADDLYGYLVTTNEHVNSEIGTLRQELADERAGTYIFLPNGVANEDWTYTDHVWTATGTWTGTAHQYYGNRELFFDATTIGTTRSIGYRSFKKFLVYKKDAAKLYPYSYTFGASNLGSTVNGWKTLSSRTAGGTGTMSGSITINWSRLSRGTRYEVAFIKNGVTVNNWVSTSYGPYTVFGDGRHTFNMDMKTVPMGSGDTFIVRARTDSTVASHGAYSGGSGTWNQIY